MKTSPRLLSLSLLTLAVLAGCSTVPPQNTQLEQARTDLATMQADPQSRELAAVQLKQADDAVNAANTAWMKKDDADRKPAEAKMMADWAKWMDVHSASLVDKGAGVGRPKRVTKDGIADARNDIMLYSFVEAESHDDAAKLFEGHPHFGIPEASIEVMEVHPMGEGQGM